MFDVNRVANLVRLKLNEEEKKRLAVELSVILNYFENLKEVDTSEIKSISQISDLENITRKDEIKERETGLNEKIIDLAPASIRDEAIRGGPAKQEFIKIKRVLE